MSVRARGRILPVAVLLTSAIVSAQEIPDDGEHWRDEPFWEDLAEPTRRAFRREIERGRELLSRRRSEILGEGIENPRGALRRFERAIDLLPTDPMGPYWKGRALQKLERHREAIAAFRRARALDESGELENEIAFRLGVELTIEMDLEAALVEYDRALRHVVASHSRPTCISNSAEVLMTLGRLREAIARYREAIAEVQSLAIGREFSRALALYGLAAALDRDDQPGLARQRMREGWAYDPRRSDPVVGTAIGMGTLGNYRTYGVFFVPEHDVHYYRGLLLEARADAATNLSARQDLLEAALNEWRTFLGRGGAAGPWAHRAREHAAAVERRLGRSGGDLRPPRRRPRLRE